MQTDRIKVGLLGLGVVGSGVFHLLEQNGALIARQAGLPVEIKKILVRDLSRKRRVEAPRGLLTTDPAEILEDPEIGIIVEVMGGLEQARQLIMEAFRRGKSVVTANKDLLSQQGEDLFEASGKAGADLFFEASVAGGIPIIAALKDSLAGNRLEQVIGIVNGTTNYILTRMSKEGRDFGEALAEAQELGYAEADPSADVDGLDAARKVAILASIAFQSRVTSDQVFTEGIRRLTRHDITYGQELGYAVKLLGIAQEREGEVEVRVHPAFIPLSHPLAAVNDSFNAIFVRGDAVGEAMFYGRGAGQLPTASAVVGDLIAAARNLRDGVAGRAGCTCFQQKPLRPMGRVRTRYYLRLTVKDQAGVLACIAGVFGREEVSIASLVQKRTMGSLAEIVFITHQVQEENLRRALEGIKELPAVAEIGNVIRVEGGEQ